jgi:methionyl-tRNA formyltransferase
VSLELLYFSSGPRERVLNALLQAGHRVLHVFVTDPKRWPRVRPTLDLAREKGVPVATVSRADLANLGASIAGRLCLSAGFGYIFPPEFISAARLCLNVHGTLLPMYRGARTLNWVIEEGETESGVTVHRVDAGVDTGPILLQRAFPVSRFDTGASLYRKTLEFEPGVVLEAMSLLEAGNATFRPQPADARQHPNRTPEHSRIDPSRPLTELYDKIRAADPERYPAHFYLDGEKVCIRLWRPDRREGEDDLV